MSDFEDLGGRVVVGELVERFVRRAAEDFIIGFFFEGKDLERIIKHETELACMHLGGESEYTGRSLESAHKPLKINHGQFRRRLAILRTTLTEAGVAQEIVERWVACNQAEKAKVVINRDCVD
jgi:hemoglobin